MQNEADYEGYCKNPWREEKISMFDKFIDEFIPVTGLQIPAHLSVDSATS